MATTFTFQMRAYAAAHFDWDQALRINFPGGATCLLQSEYTGGESGRAYPVTIFGEIRGDYEDLGEAQIALSALLGGDILPVISLATNAAVETPLPVACFGVDLSEPRPFIGYQTPRAETFFPPGKRRIDIEGLTPLMAAVGSHEVETAVLRRANEMFRHAVLRWNPEERLLGGEFLYLAVETLGRFLLESRAKAGGMTPRNLAKAEGARNTTVLRSRYLAEIFEGDDEALDALEKASNGFEHGYMGINAVRKTMEPILDRSLTYIRAALIKASGVDEDTVDRLLSDKYAEPRPLVPPMSVVEGRLAHEGDDPVKESVPWGMIDLTWENEKTKAVERDGDVDLNFSWEVRASNLPESSSLEMIRQGMSAGYVRLSEKDPQPSDPRSSEEPPDR